LRVIDHVGWPPGLRSR